MAVVTGSLLLDVSLSIITLVLFFVLYLNSKYKYWKNRGVPYVMPDFFYGNFKETIEGKTSMVDVHCKIYAKLKGERFGGYFYIHVPDLMILDPKLISAILVKDFSSFYDRSLLPADIKHEPLSNSMGMLQGHDWRYQRQKLSPTFSPSKLKEMLNQIYNCGDELMEELEKYSNNGEAIEAKDVMSMFTGNVIATCAFGLQFKVNSPEEASFRLMSASSFPKSRFVMLFVVLRAQYKTLSNLLGIKTFTKEATEYFINLTKETVRYRKEKSIQRNDFLQLLMKLQEEEETGKTNKLDEREVDVDNLVNQLQQSDTNKTKPMDAKVMTDEWIAANSFMFMVAGSEVSTSTSLVLFSLAQNPTVQARLQQEVDTVIAKHKTVNYESLKDMVYMDQVIQETLRLYPISSIINRICTSPYRIPDSDVVLEKGTWVTIPVWAIHRDPEFYPNPEVFDPDRFVNNNYKPSSTYLPFGDGPRVCIGMRFSILEIKVCLTRIMTRYSVQLSGRTNKITLDPCLLFPRPEDGIWITVKKRES